MIRSNANMISKRKLDLDRGISAVNVKRSNLTPNFGVLIVSLLAMTTVQMFRIGHTRSLPIVILEVLVFFALPWIVYAVLRYRFRTSPEFPFTKKAIFGFQFGAILTGILVMLWHISIRPFGFGDANEIVALLILQNISWYLAVFSKVPGFEKTNALLSGALVFFVCCLSDERRIFLIAGLFAFSALWWLLGQYWGRLETKAIDGDSRLLKLHGSAVSLTMLAVILVGCLAATIPFVHRENPLIGFMPFSGGEQGGQNEFAISGIGDGNMLTAGNNAKTSGAVESDQFIEDDKPSLYDITSERYDGPIVKKRNTKAKSLEGIAKHLHDAKKSEQAGRTFHTMRNSSETTDIELKDRITKALLFVEGSVPARFSINHFFEFDGRKWNNTAPYGLEPEKLPRIHMKDQNGSPVFRLGRSIAKYLTSRRTHRVKIMRLDTQTIPSPALLQQWHIPLVDRMDMFRWSEKELIEMDIPTIPSHSIIDIQSLVPNFHLLREHPDLRVQDRAAIGTPVTLQIPQTESQPAIQTLANQWTEGIEPGWMQVESIVNHLRNDFALDPNWDEDEEANDTVSLFLDQGRGPSYMFATSCALALRSAGYKTRVASGFLVQKKDYDSRAQQSIVTSANLHMWPEVCLDGKFWIPVEPTPGYPIPYNTQTVMQWVATQALMVWYWVLENPLSVALFIGSVFLAFFFRAEIITRLMLGWWFLVRIFWPQRLLQATRQLIDLRFRFAGDRRPASETINVWYTRVESNTLGAFFKIWNANNYSEKTTPTSRQELVLTCEGAVKSLSLKRIRASRNDNTNTSSK